MAKTFINLNDIAVAEEVGLKLTVKVSIDLEEVRYSFHNGDAEEFTNLAEDARWLDGYKRGHIQEKAALGRKNGIC